LRLKPDDPRALFYLGLALRLDGNDDAANDSFTRALASNPSAQLRSRIESFLASTPASTTTTATP
jgi:cytochrome c-type biogenesis protein CcmH/NrfG